MATLGTLAWKLSKKVHRLYVAEPTHPILALSAASCPPLPSPPEHNLNVLSLFLSLFLLFPLGMF